ncbi:hypothetical protein BUALT_Bualt19G0073100 [Buddleja alternifolia]|uniref:Uncharacterized protein n=1 Tax=Buddleja alternifolia TaxID=168488 RepID=A0AAV6WAD6_9LAMI|nr:hypothetical protein BUALT_Bualt19G0073100 [Buddleja alternifolia]
MDRIGPNASDLDLYVGLESGDTTSDEDASKCHELPCENSRNLMITTRSGFMGSESPYFSSSYKKLSDSDESSGNNKEQMAKFREVMVNFLDEKEKSKKKKFVKPSKPPRPPRGPLSSACDMKLLKEISEMNSKHGRRKRMRMLKKIRKKKESPFCSNVL